VASDQWRPGVRRWSIQMNGNETGGIYFSRNRRPSESPILYRMDEIFQL
jgi:hypothetical protein